MKNPWPAATGQGLANPKASREVPSYGSCWRVFILARSPKPWWREDRQAWFVTIRGERHNLGPDKDAADRGFYRLMSEKPEESVPPKSAGTTGLSVAEVFDKYLDWCKKHRAGRTYDWYRDHIQSFTDFLTKPAQMPVAAIKPFHVVEWADEHVNWGDTYRRGAIVAIQRPFNWAAKLGYIDVSPNPIDVAFPGLEEPPIVIDMATSAAAYGKIEIALRAGKPIPERWAIDSAGQAARRPQQMIDGGALVPLGGTRDQGGHKGYCLAALVDIMSGVLGGANWGPFAPPFVLRQEIPSRSVGKGIGHLFGALRIDGFIDVE
jgi:hypothetical protein